MTHEKPRIRLLRFEPVKDCGYFEVRFPDDRASLGFSWDDNLGRHFRQGMMTQAEALEKARAAARREREKAQSVRIAYRFT